MKKTIALCVSGLLAIGGLQANPTTSKLGKKPATTTIQSMSTPKKHKAGNWDEGNMIFTLGYGFPNMGKVLFNSGTDVVDYKATGFGPIHFRFEYALSESFGIGLSSNFNKYGYSDNYPGQVYNSVTGTYQDVTYNESLNVTAINFLVRFNKHWAAGSKADVFSGLGLGYSYHKYTWASNDPDNISYSGKGVFPVGFESTIGVRIFFTPNFVGYVEAGYAKSIIQAGIGYKIGS